MDGKLNWLSMKMKNFDTTLYRKYLGYNCVDIENTVSLLTLLAFGEFTEIHNKMH